MYKMLDDNMTPDVPGDAWKFFLAMMCVMQSCGWTWYPTPPVSQSCASELSKGIYVDIPYEGRGGRVRRRGIEGLSENTTTYATFLSSTRGQSGTCNSVVFRTISSPLPHYIPCL